MSARQLRYASFVTLGLLALLGTFLVLRATPEGLGLSDDSIAYIAGARSMLAGQGYREAWLASNGPVTHLPPGFSSLLAFIGLFGLDPLRGARLVNSLLFGLNTLLLGILGWRMTKSLLPGLILAALFVANASLLRVHAVAMSEPLYLFLSLLALWTFDLYFERDFHWLWLALCGIFTGMAYLTRYAGLALVATFIVALFILHATWRKRWTGLGIFAAAFLPWAAGWAVLNWLVAGNTTNRTLVWHPITVENLTIGLRTVSEFLMPVEAWRQALMKIPGLFQVLIVLVLAVLLVWLVNETRRHFARPASAGRPEAIVFTNALYVFTYLVSIAAAMSLFDASTKFKVRILAPVFMSLLVLLVAAGMQLWKDRRPLFLGLAALLLGLSAYGQVAAVGELMKGGQGYASFQWYDSQAMKYLKGLPFHMKIYTNQPGAVYLYIGRGTYVLPNHFDPVTAEVRPGFEQGVRSMQDDILAGQAVLALFGGGEVSSEDAAVLSHGLYLAHKSGGDEVYTAAP